MSYSIVVAAVVQRLVFEPLTVCVVISWAAISSVFIFKHLCNLSCLNLLLSQPWAECSAF